MHPQSPALRALAEKWDAVPAAERANYQLYLTDLAHALDVAAPQPRGSGYEFDFPVQTTVPLVTRHLETLAMVGEVRLLPDGRYEAVTEPL